MKASLVSDHLILSSAISPPLFLYILVMSTDHLVFGPPLFTQLSVALAARPAQLSVAVAARPAQLSVALAAWPAQF